MCKTYKHNHPSLLTLADLGQLSQLSLPCVVHIHHDSNTAPTSSPTSLRRSHQVPALCAVPLFVFRPLHTLQLSLLPRQERLVRPCSDPPNPFIPFPWVQDL